MMRHVADADPKIETDPVTRRVMRDQDVQDDLADVLTVRARRWLAQVGPALQLVYPDVPDLLERALTAAVRAAVARPEPLRRRDRLREIDHDWFQSETMVGYVTYVDRFDVTLEGIGKHLDHLADLGVTYLHLMPLLASRPGPNDGGYAVIDYRAVDPDLGSVPDLAGLARDLHAHQINLCIDLVVNHTAAEHVWARQALAGDERYLDFYCTYAEREIPDAYETTLPEVFPDTAPGNFTWNADLKRWVWTTFNPWQWDLNWANPDVFVEMLAVMLDLSAVGIDVLRLDAIPFMWKRLGTNCQNLPEVHLLLQALRGLMAIAAPATIFKGEAIVAHHDLVAYQGAGPRLTAECDLLYHNQLMVQGWSSLAAQDGRLATLSLAAMAETPDHASWVTYVRCHDDIGWAIGDGPAAARGWDGPSHRHFLSRFYAGELDYSYAEGEHFQEDFVTGDRRTNGSAAALAGITRAQRIGDWPGLEAAIDRLLLLYALAASYGGIPLIYMGDEVALGNDRSYLEDPDRASDNRWLQRPVMDWSAVQRRHDPGTVQARVFDGIAHLMRVRSQLPTLRAGGTVSPRHHDNDHVLAFMRRHPRTGRFVGLANFSEQPQLVDPAAVGVGELCEPFDALTPAGLLLTDNGRVRLAPLQMCWISEPSHRMDAVRQLPR